MPSEKKQLLAQLENKTGPESELILAKEFNLSPQTHFKQKIQQDESVRIELTFSKEQMESLNRAKELLSHALPGATLVEVVHFRGGSQRHSKNVSEADSFLGQKNHFKPESGVSI